MDRDFASAAAVLPPRIQSYLFSLPDHITSQASEIRLRADALMTLTVKGKTVLLNKNDPPALDTEVMEEIFLRLCRNSVYSHADEISSGYITTEKGHRVGICGKAVTKDGQITSVTDISAMNIRIRRRHKNAADSIMPLLNSEKGLVSALIFGPPLSGKTTLLREIAHSFASLGARVAVIDERRELIEKSTLCLDVFSGYPRLSGIEQAIRLFSPDVIIFDELGNENDTLGLQLAANAGVAVITSAHGADLSSLKKRKFLRDTVNSGIFDLFIRLGKGEQIGRLQGLYGREGEELENSGNNYPDGRLFDSRQKQGITI